METIVNFYPVFEGDQVLTADSLNAVVNYLEQQERLTRNKLIGIGIVCGLELTNTKTPFSINISYGCGVTSAGYLIVQGSSVLRNYTNYEDPAGYTYFSDSKGKQNITLWELLEETETRTGKTISKLEESTSDFKLGEMAVILYLEVVNVDLRTCTESECNEKGKRRDLIVRRLLISKLDLIKIINKCKKKFTPQALNELKLRDSILAKYKLKELNIKRLSRSSAKIIEYNDLVNFYKEAVDGFTDKTADALLESYNVYKDMLSIHYKTVNPMANVKSVLNSYKQNSFLHTYKLQYYYDCLKDIVTAYNDFREIAFELMCECCPDESCFPFHLMVSDALVKKNSLPTIFRSYFIPSPVLNNQSNLLNKAITLYIRLVEMCSNFSIPDIEQAKIKITPSNEDLTPLEKRSIPYYFSNSPYSINKNWSYDLKRKFRSEYNMSYHSDKYINETAAEEVLNALDYNIDEYPFLRIEGHIGKSYRAALKEIIGQKNKYNLPFEVIGLKLGKDFKDTSASIKCLYKDLEAMYNYLRSELICILTKETRYFSSLNFRRDILKTDKDFDSLFTGRVFTGTAGMAGMAVSEYKTFMHSAIGGLPESDTIGQIYDSYSNESVKTHLGTYTYNFLRDKDLLSILGENYDIITYFNYPIELIDEIEEIVNKLPEDVNNFNIDSFSTEYSSLLKLVVSYKKEVLRGNAKNKEELLDHLDKLYYDCTLSKFKSLFEDFKKRTDEIKKMNLFYNYIRKHPGLEHKAGVEKGGTFILVYADVNDFEDENDNFRIPISINKDELFNKLNSIGLVKENAKVLSAAISNKTRDSSAGIETPMLYTSMIRGFNDLNLANLKPEEANTITNKAIDTIKNLLNESNMVVVADFCLPYICCSDCPPITFVVNETAEKVSIFIKPNEFCSNDKTEYGFTVSPLGGTITGPGVTNNKLTPAAVILAANEDVKEIQFIYTSTDNRTAAASAKVYRSVDAKFEYKISDTSQTKAFVTFTNRSSAHAKTYFWDFGDGLTSAEKNPPVHTYDVKKPGNFTFKVKLTVTNGACSNTFEDDIKISIIQLVPTVSVAPVEFCINDKASYNIVVTPDDPNGKLTVNGSLLNRNTSGKYTFTPVSMINSIGNNSVLDVKLEYSAAGSTSVPFVIKVYNMPIPKFSIKKKSFAGTKTTVTFENSSGFGVNNQWHVVRSMGNSSQDLGVLGTTSNNNEAVIEFDTSQGIAGYTVILKVTNGKCSVESNPLNIKITELRG